MLGGIIWRIKNKEVWKKWWFWVIVIVIFFVLPFAETDDTVSNNEIIEENNSSTDSNIVQTEESELKSELFGDSNDKKNYFFNNEKANVKITNVDWKNNHQMADIRFDNMSVEFNKGSDVGFLIEFEFENEKK